MILLDTNVVSATMAPSPPHSVIEWLNGQDSITLYVSTITIAEIMYGLQVLPESRHRQSLVDRFDTFMVEGFEQRVLDFDRRAARVYGDVMSRRQAMGRPLSALDGQIAAIARANHLTVATRNVRDFKDCELELVNPFETSDVPQPVDANGRGSP